MNFAVRELLEPYRRELEDLRDQVEDGLRQAASQAAMGSRCMARLDRERMDLAKKCEMLQDSLKDKERVEAELRERVERAAGAAPRPSAAEHELRQAVADRDARVAQLEAQLAASQAAAERAEVAAAREASLAAVQTAGAGAASNAEVAELRGAVEAGRGELQRLHSELETAARQHSLQVQELQDTFHKKVKEMRRLQGEQLDRAREQAAASASAAVSGGEEALGRAIAAETALKTAKEAAQRQIQALSLKLEQAEDTQAQSHNVSQQLQSGVEANKRLTQKLFQSEEAAGRLAAEKKALAGQLASASSEVAKLRQRVSALEAQAPAGGAPAGGGAGGGGGQSEEEVEALNMMEAQLLRLSDIIRDKEHEMVAMRRTVQTECAERAALQRELNKMKAAASEAAAEPSGGLEPAGQNFKSQSLPPVGVNPKPGQPAIFGATVGASGNLRASLGSPPVGAKQTRMQMDNGGTYVRSSRHVNRAFR